jgi:hypothetical protein
VASRADRDLQKREGLAFRLLSVSIHVVERSESRRMHGQSNRSLKIHNHKVRPDATPVSRITLAQWVTFTAEILECLRKERQRATFYTHALVSPSQTQLYRSWSITEALSGWRSRVQRSSRIERYAKNHLGTKDRIALIVKG